MLDVLIQGGTVVSPDASEPFDIGVKDGRIVVFAAPRSLDLEATRVIDAHGKYVIPGGIEPHARARDDFVRARGGCECRDARGLSLIVPEARRAHGLLELCPAPF